MRDVSGCKTRGQVSWVTNHFVKGNIRSPAREVKDGIAYLRTGPCLTGNSLNYLWAYPAYLAAFIKTVRQKIRDDQPELIIDEIHGLPCFSPALTRGRVAMLACEVAGPIWDRMFPFPLNKIGRTLEQQIYTLYRGKEIWAISENTKKDILSVLPGLNVKILPLGFDPPASRRKACTPAQDAPSGILLSRLVKMKGVETAIEAAAIIARALPAFKLFILGSGDADYQAELRALVANQNIEGNVVFAGRVSEDEKYEMLGRAHFLFHPSWKEGFGLTVLEAGAVGTPSIVRSGSALSELVEEGVNGFHFSTPSELAQVFLNNWQSMSYCRLRGDAQAAALSYTWDKVLPLSRRITFIP